ncbi:MAG: PQQ-binding-like beta-propeller repeat protein [Cephaloticoccus sp.]|nr:PQQ-binding-like beta-propeller repeat protein [Cephaloticoccus sp.]
MPRHAIGFLLVLLAPVLLATTTPDPITGSWTGTVHAPQGTAALTLQFAQAEGGRFDVTVDFPLMHTYGFTFPAAAEFADGRYTFYPLAVQLALDGEQLHGTFGPGKLPLILHRGGNLTPRPAAPVYPAAPAPRWTHLLGAPSWASPTVADGIVYVGATDGRFHAVRATDGFGVWSWSGPHRIDGRAVVAGDAVYFVDGHVDLVCLDRSDGSLRWRHPLHDQKIAGNPAPENPTFNRRTATPLVVDDTVYCGSSDGGLYALNTVTGETRWHHAACAPIFSGLAQFDERTIAFGCMDGAVILLDRHTQKEFTRFQTGGGVVTTPVLAQGKIVAGSRDYMLYAFDRANGRTAWKYSYWFSWIESTPLLFDGVLYVGASDYRRVTALDPENGRQIWSTDVRGLAWGSPAVNPDTVFIGTVAQNLPGTVIHHIGGVIALDRRTGAVKWQFRSASPPENSFGGYAGSLAHAGDLVIGAGMDGILTAWPVN